MSKPSLEECRQEIRSKYREGEIEALSIYDAGYPEEQVEQMARDLYIKKLEELVRNRYRWLKDEESEHNVLRFIFVVSEIGDVADAYAKYNIELSKFPFSNKEVLLGIKHFLITGMGDIIYQTRLMCSELDFNFDEFVKDWIFVKSSGSYKEEECDIRFASMIKNIGKIAYSLKHIVRGTSKLDRSSENIEKELKEFVSDMYGFCSVLGLDPFEIYDIGEKNYKERYQEWVKAGRFGKWV